MKRGTRRILFYLAVAVFVAASYLVILYAQGYRYSFTQNKFLHTGTISLRANTDAKVFIDGRYIGDTSFLSNSFSVSNLVPKEYTIRMKKDNYYFSWQKKIAVQEGLLSDFPKIILLPESGAEKTTLIQEVKNIFNPVIIKLSPSPALSVKPSISPSPSFSPNPSPSISPTPYLIKNKILYSSSDNGLNKIADDVKGFSLSPDGNKLAWWTSTNSIWVLWLHDQNYQPYKKKGDKENITTFSERITGLAWFRDNDHLVLNFNSKYKITEIDTRGGLNIVEL